MKKKEIMKSLRILEEKGIVITTKDTVSLTEPFMKIHQTALGMILGNKDKLKDLDLKSKEGWKDLFFGTTVLAITIMFGEQGITINQMQKHIPLILEIGKFEEHIDSIPKKLFKK